VLAAVLLAASPAAKISRSPVLIRNGPNKIDFAGDGSHGLIVKAHRENGNAHSFEAVSFYLLVEDSWNIVPIGWGEGEQDMLRIAGGADCVLHDFRLLPGGKDQPATLILADREIGESFADTRDVTFTWYSLVHNLHDQDPLGPNYYFQKSRTETSKKPYCDVEEAFKEELQY